MGAHIKRLWAVLGVAVAFSFLMPRFALAFSVLEETVAEEQIAAGASLKRFFQKTGDGPLRIYVVTVDLRNPYLRVKTLVGNNNEDFSQAVTVREMAERSGAVAALNGDFFHVKEGKHPLGMTVRDAKLLSSPMQRNDCYSFALTQNGTPVIDLFRFSGEVIAPNGLSFHSLSGINKPSYFALRDGQAVDSDMHALHMYTPAWGPESRGSVSQSKDIVEMVVAEGKVTEIRQDMPPAAIPADGYILRGHGIAAAFLLDNFEVGDPVTVLYRLEPNDKEIVTAVGGQALLVANGRRVEPFSQNIKGRTARSAVGISRDGGTLHLVAVEQSGDSRGMSQEELADFMVERLGVWRALNLDGGGSTSLVARPLGDFQPILVNTPAKEAERKVPDALGVFSTAPPGRLAGLVVRGPKEVIAGLPYRYTVGAYDTYFNPYAINAGDVVWKLEQGSGVIEGGVLTAGTGGDVVVTADTGGVTGKLNVRALGPEDMAALEVSPGRVALEPGGQMKLNVQLRGKDGRIWPVPAQYISWESQEDVGEIREGVLCAATELTAGVVTANFLGLKASVPVEIAPPGHQFLWFGPEGATVRAGKFDIRIAPGIFADTVPVSAGTYSVPSDLPPGYTFLDGIALKAVKSQLPEPSYLVRWSSEGLESSRVVFLLRGTNTTGAWVPQPTAGSGTEPVVGRVYGFGEVVVARCKGEISEPADVGGHWSRDAVKALMARNIVHGFPDGTFRPEDAVTRAQFTAMLASALGWTAPEKAALPFHDTIPDWAAPGVRAAVSRGVVAGYPDGRFLPDKSITRAEMAAMIDRALKLPEGENASYKDDSVIPRWAAPAVRRTAAAGLMRGSGGCFRPLAAATRGETAALIAKTISYYARW